MDRNSKTLFQVLSIFTVAFEKLPAPSTTVVRISAGWFGLG
jgi:hypothetical protein